MEVFTEEIAHALGVRDRISGGDAEARNITLDRLDGRLHGAYWQGQVEADYYADFMWNAGARYGAPGNETASGDKPKAETKPASKAE